LKNQSTEDQSILDGIRAGSKAEDAALTKLYESHWSAIRAYVLKNNGSEDDANDVFQDGVIAFHKNVVTGKFKGESAIGTYLYSICRFIWLKKLRSTNKMPVDSEADEPVSYEDPEHRFLDAEKRSLMAKLFDQIGEPCRTILTLSYYDNLPMSEIASQTGFKDEQNARNKKYKCMKALKTLIISQPGFIEALKN
jgi:RNA polymerase sigma factor (sigma-70 family)